MRKINVCQVVLSLDVGGLEKVVVSLLKHLDVDRFNLHLVCLTGRGKLFDHIDPGRVRTLVLDKEKGRVNLLLTKVNVACLARMWDFFRKNHVDIVHAHNWAPLIYSGFTTRLQPGCPYLVYTEHNQINSATRWDAFKFRSYVRLADEVAVVSKDLEGVLQARLGLGQNIRVLHNGIDGARFQVRADPEFRRTLPVSDEDFVVGTAVVLSEQKGIRYLIEAAKIACAASEKIKFLVAGDGPLRTELERSAQAAGLGGKMSFLGYRSDIPQLVSCFDLYVLPSLWEGLPLALIEALALGKPVVATRVGGNAEIIEEGVNGYLVPPRDSEALARAVLKVVGDRGALAGFQARNVQKFRAEFSLERMIEEHTELYLRAARIRGKVPG